MPFARHTNGSTNSPGGTIYLLRHGAIQSLPGGRRYIGWQDLPLNRIGLEQAAAWAEYFEVQGLDEICCSDLTRCRETADIVGKRCSLAPHALPALREVRLGQWEGKSFEEMKTRHPQEFEARGEQIADHRPPGGESFRDLQNRTWPVFEALVRRPGNRTLMVTHAGVIRVLLCRLLGMPLENLFSIGQGYGALNIVDVRPQGFRLQGLNFQPSRGSH
jgi:alpha-ribazole phosphatase